MPVIIESMALQHRLQTRRVAVEHTDDLRLAHRPDGIDRRQQIPRLDPVDAPEARHQMGAGDGDAVEMEIGEARVELRRRMAREKALSEARLGADMRLAQHGDARAGQRIVEPCVPSKSSETRGSRLMFLACSERSEISSSGVPS